MFVSFAFRLSYGLLTKKCCEALASVLKCSSTCFKAVDLSGNSIQDAGVELLSAGLRSPNCKLEILRSQSTQTFLFRCTYSTFNYNVYPLQGSQS